MIRPDVYEILKEAVSDGLQRVREVESQNKPVSRYRDFPKLEYFDSGLPRFSKILNEEERPKDYRSIFVDTEGMLLFYSYRGAVLSESIPTWKRFWDLARSDEYLGRYLEPDEFFKKSDEQSWAKDWHAKYEIYGAIRRLVDRYIYTTGQTEFDEESFKPI